MFLHLGLFIHFGHLEQGNALRMEPVWELDAMREQSRVSSHIEPARPMLPKMPMDSLPW